MHDGGCHAWVQLTWDVMHGYDWHLCECAVWNSQQARVNVVHGYIGRAWMLYVKYGSIRLQS
jgi:hypothetical protein